MAPEEYGILYALARVTPGTNMLAFCAGAGWLLHGWIGAVLAVTAVTLPSAILAVVILKAFEVLMQNAYAAAAISAMIAAAVGLMFAAAWLLLRPRLGRSEWMRTGLIAVAAFVLAWKAVLSPVQVLGLAGLVGLLWKGGESR